MKCPAQSVVQPWRVSLPGCTAPRGRLLHPGAGKSGQCRERPLTPWAAADPGMRARLSVHLSEGPGQRRLQAVGVAAGPLGQLVLRPRCWPEVVEPQRRLTAQPSSVPVLTRGRGRLRLQATPCGRPALSLQVRPQLQPRPLGLGPRLLPRLLLRLWCNLRGIKAHFQEGKATFSNSTEDQKGAVGPSTPLHPPNGFLENF